MSQARYNLNIEDRVPVAAFSIYQRGAIVNSTQDAVTTVTVHRGHSIKVSDKFVYAPSRTNIVMQRIFTCTARTATTVAFTPAFTFPDKSLLINLGVDTGAVQQSDGTFTLPNWDGSTFTAYKDPDGTSTHTNASVGRDPGGEVGFWGSGQVVWGIARDTRGAATRIYPDMTAASTSDIYDIRDYGAVGDGSTDDAAAIQDAIDAAEVAGAGTVFIPVGTHLIGTQLDIADPDLQMFGVGRGSILKASSAIDLINVNAGASANTGIIISNIHFNLNSQNATGINFTNGNSSVARDIHVTLPGATAFGIRTNGGAHETVIDGFDYWVASAAGTALEIDTNNCKVENGSIIAATLGVSLTPAATVSKLAIRGMRITDCTDGIKLATRGMLGLSISRTRFEGNTSTDIDLKGFDNSTNRLFQCNIADIYTSTGASWKFENIRGLHLSSIVFKGWVGTSPAITFVGSNQAVSEVFVTNVTTDASTTVDIFKDDNITTDTYALRPWGVSQLNSTSNKVDCTLGSPGSTGGTSQSAVGTIKTIVMTNATNLSTVSVTNHETSDPEIITFAAVDDTAVLMWTGTEWITIKLSGATV